MMRKVTVTGASGYIGQFLTGVLLENGLEVNALVRNSSFFPETKNLTAYNYMLGEEPDPAAFIGVDAIFHLAANTNNSSAENENIEICAAEQLIRASKENDVKKVIFLSSQSASKNSTTSYGRTKWQIERRILEEGGLAVRPGLVYGGDEKALFGTLCSIAKKFPVIPKFYPPLDVQPIHIKELCQGLLTILKKDDCQLFTLNIASEKSMDISEFLKQLAWYRYHRYVFSIPFPTVFLHLLSKIFLRKSSSSRISSERINGLLSLKMMSTSKTLDVLQLNPCPLSKGLPVGKNRRRDLLEEGHAFICYLSNDKSVSYFSLRLYVKAVEKLYEGTALDISLLFLAFPKLIRLIDPKNSILSSDVEFRSQLGKRMDNIVSIIETNPQKNNLFTSRKSTFFPLAILYLAKDVTIEVMLSMISFFIKSCNIFHERKKG